MAESAANGPHKTHKPLRPAEDVKAKMKPISREAFKNLLKRAITPPAPKPAPKST
jgi:hypothetical protein